MLELESINNIRGAPQTLLSHVGGSWNLTTIKDQCWVIGSYVFYRPNAKLHNLGSLERRVSPEHLPRRVQKKPECTVESGNDVRIK